MSLNNELIDIYVIRDAYERFSPTKHDSLKTFVLKFILNLKM